MANLSFNGPNANVNVTVDPATGTYTANVPAGTYNIQLPHEHGQTPNVPAFNLTANDFIVTGNTILNLALPVTPVTVHVRDANGNPVTASINVDMPMPGQPAPGVHPTINFRHNGFSGYKFGSDVVVPATPGNLRLSVTPSNGPFPGGTAITTNLTVTAPREN